MDNVFAFVGVAVVVGVAMSVVNAFTSPASDEMEAEGAAHAESALAEGGTPRALAEGGKGPARGEGATSPAPARGQKPTSPAVGLPTGARGQLLRRKPYMTMYSSALRLPLWVQWTLTSEHSEGPYGRKGINFEEDDEVPAPRATNADYTRSGYDRGHMCPAADCHWSRAAIVESFLYTNCCPQLHSLNAGDWKELEERCRVWAQQYGAVHIVCGPLLVGKTRRTIGRNRVVVPEAFFKVVLRTGRNAQAIGFIYRNEAANRTMSAYVNTVDEVERITGYDFFPGLPDDVERRVEAKADLNAW